MQAGMVLYFFLLTVAVTAIVSPWVMWRYGAAVLQGMRRAAGSELPLPGQARRADATAAAGDARHAGGARLAWERAARRRAVTAWLLCTGLAALPLALLHNRIGDLPLTPAHVVLVLGAMILVAMPPIALSLGWDWVEGLWRTALLTLAAAAVCLAVSLLQRIALGRAPSADQALNLVFYYQFAATLLWLPLLLFLASSAARIRGVVPMIFGGLVIFGAAPFVASELWGTIGATEAGTRAMLGSAWLSSRHLLLAALVLPFGVLMGWRLHALAEAYGMKRFSDVQLLARAWWLMFVALVAIELLNVHPDRWWGAAGAAVVILLFGPLQRTAFRAVPVARDAPAPITLLLLRVFGFRSRTERLFDRIGARWRYHGPVTMIAAPDVVSRTIDAVDFLDWLLGRSGASFVRNAEELRARLAAIDGERDPDGRFRVSEFCCADNTWRATVVELMQRADVVLMDLRGISGERKGCEFELQQLRQRVPPQRVVLVVEPGADRSALNSALGAAADRVRWFEMKRDRRASNRALFAALIGAASGDPAAVD